VNVTLALDPTLLRIGGLEIAWHGVLTALAVLAGVWLGTRRAERAGFSGDAITTLVLWGVLGGVVGARLFHVADHLPYFLEHPLEIVAVWQGGIAVYGGFIGGLIAGAIAAARSRLPAWPLLDAAAPAMLVGQAIGRLGCLSNGDAWGAPCEGAFGLCITYVHPGALLPASLLGVPTHAYPVYEILAELLLLGILWLVARRTRVVGLQFLSAAVGYAVIRFSLSYLRQEPQVLWGLQEAQVVAVATAALAIGAFAWRSGRPSPAGALQS
jgi:phosphatidylglycerol:prolipoprotein diacylglycerol transferase